MAGLEPSEGEVRNLAPKKEKAPKKQLAKKQKYDEDNQYYKMAVYFFNRVEKVAEEAGVGHLLKKSNMQTWADDMRKLVEISGVDKRLAKEVMDWVTEDSFWKKNILSAKKLRDKFPELAIKMKAEQDKAKPAARKPDTRDREIALQQWISEGTIRMSSTGIDVELSAEQSVLGAVFLDAEVLDDISFLEPRDFSSPVHADIYKAMRWLEDKHKPIDFVSVMELYVRANKQQELTSSYLLKAF